MSEEAQNDQVAEFDIDAYLAEDEEVENESEEEKAEENEEVESEIEDTPEKESSEEVNTEKEEEKEEHEENENTEKWQLKVEGQEVEYDPNNIEETKAWMQKGMSAQKKWEEAAAVRNEANKFMENLKSNPREILENPALGIDLVSIAEEVLYEKLEEEKMTPAERKLRSENRELRAAQHKKDIEAQQAQIQAQKEQQQRTMQEIQSTLEDSGLPVSHDNINKSIQYMRQAINAGLTNVNPKSVLDFVKRDFMAEQQSFIRGLDEGQLSELLGKDLLDKINADHMQKLKKMAPKPPQEKAKPQTAPKQSQKQREFVGDLSSWLER
jgi:hypothetical protein